MVAETSMNLPNNDFKQCSNSKYWRTPMRSNYRENTLGLHHPMKQKNEFFKLLITLRKSNAFIEPLRPTYFAFTKEKKVSDEKFFPAKNLKMFHSIFLVSICACIENLVARIISSSKIPGLIYIIRKRGIFIVG